MEPPVPVRTRARSSALRMGAARHGATPNRRPSGSSASWPQIRGAASAEDRRLDHDL